MTCTEQNHRTQVIVTDRQKAHWSLKTMTCTESDSSLEHQGPANRNRIPAGDDLNWVTRGGRYTNSPHMQVTLQNRQTALRSWKMVTCPEQIAHRSTFTGFTRVKERAIAGFRCGICNPSWTGGLESRGWLLFVEKGRSRTRRINSTPFTGSCVGNGKRDCATHSIFQNTNFARPRPFSRRLVSDR